MTVGTKKPSNHDSPPPFLPLEEVYEPENSSLLLLDEVDNNNNLKGHKRSKREKDVDNTTDNIKRAVGILIALLVLFLLYDAIFRPPEKRFIKPDASDRFLRWVQHHPVRGIVAFMLVIAMAVVLLLPVGTPLTIGCGFVYKSAYGWKLGVFIATMVSMLGSGAGAVACFLLGRYLLRDHVRTWIVKYPLFVAIDIAAAEHGLKILAMLYLTPIAPLGPLSYVSGTTSMALSHFALAKVASLPILTLYVFIGASAGALVAASASRDAGHLEENAQKLEENPTLILFGIIISVVMISTISVYIKKELFKILEREKRKVKILPTTSSFESDSDIDEDMVTDEIFDIDIGTMSPGSSKPIRQRVVSTDSRQHQDMNPPLQHA
ncbi:Snare associated golgi protein [Seminavis robusta]|uniref:Snare associated golgi protein n=1 Tax=Seminavis robusta TaxID=568900 RepID=A0A9N8DCK0_9STRA|nr:Snare associated golgi protein [Seminavis robusta]|eukprot:Sro35_g022170.1 Snare associated golgi protein (379) ;mRNA; f:6941-8335